MMAGLISSAVPNPAAESLAVAPLMVLLQMRKRTPRFWSASTDCSGDTSPADAAWAIVNEFTVAGFFVLPSVTSYCSPILKRVQNASFSTNGMPSPCTPMTRLMSFSGTVNASRHALR